MGLKELSVGRKDVFDIPIDLIFFEEGLNPREDFSHMIDIAHSIVESGQWDPIEVQLSDDGSFVRGTHGETRYRAVKYANETLGAKIKTMKCMAAPKNIDDFDIMLRHFDRGWLGKALNAIECAKVYRRLKEEKGMSVGEIADRCKKSETHVYDHLKLLEAPLTVLEAVRRGEISAAAAIEIAKKPAHKQEAYADKLSGGSSGGGTSEDKPKKITKADVEEEFDGVPKQISTKIAQKRIKVCMERIHAARKGSKEQIKWEGVKYGLESGLGMHEEGWRDD